MEESGNVLHATRVAHNRGCPPSLSSPQAGGRWHTLSLSGKEWLSPQEVEVPEALQAAVGGHPLVLQTLVRRGLADVEAARAFLDPACYRPAPPSDLPNLDRAAERLERAIERGERICVWGDFDVDGQTSTTVLISTLKQLGANVQYHIPNRERESHGVNLPVLKRLIAGGIDLMLTCDTGVTAHEPIAYAMSRGVDVIVTDHHDLPSELPRACAVVDPKMLPDTHPLRQLPGVGCAYKLAEELYRRAGRPEDAAQVLDLVALGIVTDVAVQTGDTRYLLQRGLELLRHTERVGLQALMEVAELRADWITEEHIGFVLGPRLNALGRLADATVAVEFLTTDDLSRARILATELEGLNAQRKLLCDQVTQAAGAQDERDPELLEGGAVVLSHPSWPAGVVGVLAGRLAERYHRPTVLIASPPGELSRGSARSVEGCDIRAAIAVHEEMLESFGGHPMAAGLSIDPERIPEFRRALPRTVREMCGDLGGQAPLQIDGILPLPALSLELVEELERLAPFGPGNPPLTLVSRDLVLKSHTTVGRSGEHVQLIVEDDEGNAQQVIWWQGGELPLPKGRFDLAYVVRASDYRGQRDVQVEWVDARPLEVPAAAIQTFRASQVVDHRRERDRRALLERLRAQEGFQIWSEAQARAEIGGRGRYELEPSRALVVWSTPPGSAELRGVLEKVSPETVYVFGVDPDLDHVEVFLERLAGLVKHALRAHQGWVEVPVLAVATAQRESTVRAGLAWLVARGHVVVLGEGESEGGGKGRVGGAEAQVAHARKLRLAAGDGTASADLPQATARLRALLEETAAYRAYFARADAEALIQFNLPPSGSSQRRGTSDCPAPAGPKG